MQFTWSEAASLRPAGRTHTAELVKEVTNSHFVLQKFGLAQQEPKSVVLRHFLNLTVNHLTQEFLLSETLTSKDKEEWLSYL